jgi:TRAP-type C4-dicarboxylate transport system permease small subunit
MDLIIYKTVTINFIVCFTLTLFTITSMTTEEINKSKWITILSIHMWITILSLPITLIYWVVTF